MPDEPGRVSASSGGTAWAFAALSLSREATAAEAKRSYHRLLKRVHPDKGGEAEAFLQAQRALAAVLDDLSRSAAPEWDWRNSQNRSPPTDEPAAPLERPASPEPAVEEASTAVASPSERAAAAAARARAALSACDPSSACAAFTEALTWTPGDAQLLCGRCEGLLALRRPAEALEDAKRAAALRPRSAQPQQLAAEALRALGRLAEAASALRRAKELEPAREYLSAALAGVERELAAKACAGKIDAGGPIVAFLRFPDPPSLATSAEAPPLPLRLASLTLCGQLRVWRASASEACTLLCSAQAKQGEHACCWGAASPCGTLLAVADVSGAAALWTMSTENGLQSARALLPAHALRITCGGFTPSGSTLLTGGADGEARLWSTFDGRLMRTLAGHAKYISCLALSADGAHAATGSGDGTVRVWALDGSGGDSIDEIDTVDSGAVSHLLWPPQHALAGPGNPRSLLTAHYDFKTEQARVLVWDFRVQERTRPLQQKIAALPKQGAYRGRVHVLDGGWCDGTPVAVFGVGDGTLLLLDPQRGQPLVTLRGAKMGGVTAAALSPCGRLLAAGGADGLVRVWMWEEAKLVASFGQQTEGKGGPPPATQLIWAQDGRLLVASGRDATATVWRTDACYDV